MKPFSWKTKKGGSLEIPAEEKEAPNERTNVSSTEISCEKVSCAEVTGEEASAEITGEKSSAEIGSEKNPVSMPKEMESRRRAFSDFALYGYLVDNNGVGSDSPIPTMDTNNNRQRNSNSCGTAASVLASQAATLALSFPHNISVNIESPSEDERASSEERPRSSPRTDDRSDRASSVGRDRPADESLLRVSSSDSVSSMHDQAPLVKPRVKRKSGSEDKSTPTTPVGSKRTSNASPCLGGSTHSTNSSDRNSSHSPASGSASAASATAGAAAAAGASAGPSTATASATSAGSAAASTSASSQPHPQAAGGLVRCATYTATDSHPSEVPIAFNEEDRGALKLLSASSPLITDGPKGDSADLGRVKASKYRQKKFLRNFKKQDRLINDFSCALVGDILLQGHLYISENYFAFHSNVFGYITKLLIPLTSVQKVTKEKTAKIIPNAVGVLTLSQKYVFGSLLSRDTTYRIMMRVWKHNVSPEPGDVVAIAPIVEDDSGSGGMNGEEEEEEEEAGGEEDSTSGGGPADLSAAENESNDPALGLISNAPISLEGAAPFRAMNLQGVPSHHHSGPGATGMLGKGTAFVKGLYAKAVSNNNRQGAGEGHGGPFVSFLYIPRITLLLSIATILLVLLFLAAGFMMLRISNVQEQLLMARSVPRNKMEIYQEVARWQKELHSSLASEVQLTVEKHLSNIAQVRASLDALYTLFPVTGENGGGSSETKEQKES